MTCREFCLIILGINYLCCVDRTVYVLFAYHLVRNYSQVELLWAGKTDDFLLDTYLPIWGPVLSLSLLALRSYSVYPHHTTTFPGHQPISTTAESTPSVLLYPCRCFVELVQPSSTNLKSFGYVESSDPPAQVLSWKFVHLVLHQSIFGCDTQIFYFEPSAVSEISP